MVFEKHRDHGSALQPVHNLLQWIKTFPHV